MSIASIAKAAAETAAKFFTDSIVVKSVTSGTFNPTTQTATAASTATTTVRAAVVAYKAAEIAASRGQVANGDLKVIIAVSGVSAEPDVASDYVTFDSKDWDLIDVKTVYAGEALLYELQLRRRS